MNKSILSFVFTIVVLSLAGQEYNLYQEELRTYDSEALGRSIELELSIPENLRFAADDFNIPLIVLLDKQNETAYRLNLKSINFLAGVAGQIPPCVIAGIPLENELRFQMTDARPNAEGISGIQSTEKFLFDEFIPNLRKEFPQIGSIIIIGHSRTGYLVNYLVANRIDEFDAGISCSGFYEDKSTEDYFKSLPNLNLSKRAKPFNYYMSAGTSFEESTYLKEFEEMSAAWKTSETNANFQWQLFIHPHAGHFSNFTLTVPEALIDLFQDYHAILESRFESQFASENRAMQSYLEDMDALSIPSSPTALHINSIASHFYFQEDYQTALEFIDLGIKYYPNDPGMYLFKADILIALDDSVGTKQQIEQFNALKNGKYISADYLRELMEWYESIEK